MTALGVFEGEKALRIGHISLLLVKIPLYTAPSHTETWLNRPSGGNRADKARLLTRFRRNQPENFSMALPDFSMRQLLDHAAELAWNLELRQVIISNALKHTKPPLHFISRSPWRGFSRPKSRLRRHREAAFVDDGFQLFAGLLEHGSGVGFPLDLSAPAFFLLRPA